MINLLPEKHQKYYIFAKRMTSHRIHREMQ